MNIIKHCPYCQDVVKGKNKFCNQSCAAFYNNSIYNQKRKKYYCKHCKELISVGLTRKTCCDNCNQNLVDWSKITFAEFKQKFKNVFQMNARLRDLARRVYKRSNKPKLCINCGYNKFYEVCHIKPIKLFDDQATINEINSLENLISLCPNCHWELDNNLLKITDAGIEPARLFQAACL